MRAPLALLVFGLVAVLGAPSALAATGERVIVTSLSKELVGLLAKVALPEALLSRIPKTIPDVQSKLETEWDNFAKTNYTGAREAAERARAAAR